MVKSHIQSETRKSGHQAMWLWIGAMPLWWLSGIPFGGALLFFGSPTLPLFAAMLVVLFGVGLAARWALNY